MPTVVAALQSAANELGVPAPSTFSSNTLLLSLFYATNRDLRRRKCWPQQKRTHTFAYEADRRAYPLPADFYAALQGTIYNQSKNWQLVGPLPDAEFNYVLYGAGSSPNDAYRIFGMDINPTSAGGQFIVDPLPGAVETISFDYLTKTTLLPQNWTVSTAYTTDDPDYVNVNGNIYVCDTNGTSAATVADAPDTQTANIVDGTTRWDYVSTPFNTVLVSTDQLLFDEDVTIQGIIWRYLRQKKEDFSAEFALYNSMIETALSRWRGSYEIPMGGAARSVRRIPMRSWDI